MHPKPTPSAAPGPDRATTCAAPVRQPAAIGGDTGGAEVVARLLTISATLLRREEVGFAELEWLDECLRKYEAEARDGMTLELAFGIALPDRRHGWWVGWGRQRRDEALRALRAEALPDLKPGPAAERILAMIRRYETGPYWRLDRGKQLAEAETLPSPRRWMFIALKSGAPMLRRRQLADVLGAPRNAIHSAVDCIRDG